MIGGHLVPLGRPWQPRRPKGRKDGICPRFCSRVGIRALLTNSDYTPGWIASGLPIRPESEESKYAHMAWPFFSYCATKRMRLSNTIERPRDGYRTPAAALRATLDAIPGHNSGKMIL
jgi:hypothetical protein